MSNNTTWSIDPSHSQVGFAVRHLMISTVKGRFSDFSGTVELDPTDLTTASLSVTINAASIETGTTDRDNHLRSADFLDVGAFPTLTYVSRRVERSGDEYRLIGDLTIRDVTREVPLTVSFEGQAQDPWGGQRMAFTAAGKLNRTAFGLTWNTALEAGGVLVGEDVKLSIEVQLVEANVPAVV